MSTPSQGAGVAKGRRSWPRRNRWCALTAATHYSLFRQRSGGTRRRLRSSSSACWLRSRGAETSSRTRTGSCFTEPHASGLGQFHEPAGSSSRHVTTRLRPVSGDARPATRDGWPRRRPWSAL